MGLPLQNCVIERQMPKGYTWAKFVKCWTGDPADARFFEEKQDDVGNTFPCAYFTTLITYTRDEGFTSREVKFQGDDALWAQLELSERGQVALVSCEGHIYTRLIANPDGTSYVRSNVIIKRGTVSVHAYEAQTAPLSASMPEPIRNTGLTEYDPETPAQGSETGNGEVPF